MLILIITGIQNLEIITACP